MTFSGLGKLLSIAGGFRRVPENVAPPSGRLLSEVLGGEVEVGNLQPYAVHRFRLVGFESSAESGVTPGAATPPFVTDMLRSPLLTPPTASATSSASYTVRWSGDSHCRSRPKWRLSYRHIGDGVFSDPLVLGLFLFADTN